MALCMLLERLRYGEGWYENMNVLVLIVACISLLSLIAHSFIGTKETAAIIPSRSDSESEESGKLVQYWRQSMCAFQMLTVDLFLMTIVLFTISLTDIISFERELTLFLSLVFLLWGLAWLVQLFFLKTEAKTYLALFQWAFWFICSALLFWGA